MQLQGVADKRKTKAKTEDKYISSFFIIVVGVSDLEVSCGLAKAEIII